MMQYRNLFKVIPVCLISLILFSCEHDPVIQPESRVMEVWLHRNNTIEKYQHFFNNYTGFELDVHFDTIINTFIVKHDFNDTTTLTLSHWLGSVQNPGSKGYWLDFKNLDYWNRDKALPELIRIRNEFNLTSKLIVVEGGDPNDLLNFDTLNFRTSYYIPYFVPSGLTPEEELAEMENIKFNIDHTGIKTISGYEMQHAFMQKWFPDMNKLLWHLDQNNPAVKDSIIEYTRKDPTVEVMLVSEDGWKNDPYKPFSPDSK